VGLSSPSWGMSVQSLNNATGLCLIRTDNDLGSSKWPKSEKQVGIAELEAASDLHVKSKCNIFKLHM
jgi:hypothetical protein